MKTRQNKPSKQAVRTSVKTLTLAVGMNLLAMTGMQANASNQDTYKKIGDLEIYTAAAGGASHGSVTVSLMLDTSGSMGIVKQSTGDIDSVRDDYGISCINSGDRKIFDYEVPFTDKNGKPVKGHEKVRVALQGCGTNVNNAKFDRISRLKKALVELFANGEALPESYKIGAGNYSLFGGGILAPDGKNWINSGRMVVPAKNLDVKQRLDLINYVKGLTAASNTPTAAAYAEVGAYMMGTNTTKNLGGEETVVMFRGQATKNASGWWEPSICEGVGNGKTTYNKDVWRGCAYSTTVKQLYPLVPNINSKDPEKFSQWIQDIWYANIKLYLNGSKQPHDPNNVYGEKPSSVYFGEKMTSRFSPDRHSGFPYSTRVTKKSDGMTYLSPILGSQTSGSGGSTSNSSSECDGYGIYFLTDGQPNGVTYSEIDDVMATSLNRSSFSPSNDLPNAGALSPEAAAWNYIGAYAKALRSPTNPSGKEIKTATMGFGAVFDKSSHLNKHTGKIKGNDPANCDLLTQTARGGRIDGANLCKWGLDPALGGGGFTATSNPEIVKQSIVEFAESLRQEIGDAPAGTISIPSDPLSVDNIQPYAYLPILKPAVASADTIWQGNLKKYHTLHGTLYGQNKKRLYITSSQATNQNRDYPYSINPEAKDVWQSSKGGVDVVVSGGMREKLKAPTNNNRSNVRTVFVEVIDNNKPKLVKVGVENNKLKNFTELKGYSFEDMVYLLNFLGYGLNIDTATIPTSMKDLEAAFAKASVNEKVMGGVIHSVPVLAAYGGEFDEDVITSDETRREDYLLFGSMDGALHLVEAKTGNEQFAFIPRAMFEDKNQRKALVPNSKYEYTGMPKFGVDAPWSVDASYTYDFENTPNKMKATKMNAYGGLRMGGVGIYGLDISNKDNPTLKFSINKDTTDKNGNKVFGRLGQTWAKPTPVTIQTGNAVSDRKDVLVFGGGYDMCYENPRFKLNDPDNDDAACQNKTMADGNAVYMVDAETGELLASWTAPQSASGIGSGDDSSHMIHSVVSGITVLDANNNGVVDHLYFSDLGGQIFRIDLREGVNPSGSSFTNRVVRVFNANAGADIDKNAKHINYRFYEQPIISFAEHRGIRFAVVNIASGDRSSPLHARRELDDANRIYGIYDRDLTTVKLLNRSLPLSSLLSRDINNDNLQKLDTEKMEKGKESTIKPWMDALKAGVESTNVTKNKDVKQGWYYDMIHFDGYINMPNLKTVGPGLVTGNIYYTSVYSPDYEYEKQSSCSAGIKGGTERQMYCLPWGICANSDGVLTDGSVNGVLGYLKAGPGIQEMALGTITRTEGKSTKFRTLIGQQTLNEASKGSGKRQTNSPGGDNSAVQGGGDKLKNGGGSGSHVLAQGPQTAKEKMLKVERWYDLQNSENN